MPKKYSAHLPRDPAGRNLIKEALEGYRQMNRFTDEELCHNLPQLTESESRKEYAELYAVWEHTRKHYPTNPQSDAILDQIHIQELVECRRLWDKIAQGLAKRVQKSSF
ncbi:MAG: hypothetical protein ONB44_13020 [candidate division KSB1 bacterium]|nr:hypothetical protein [candidate division KSB1 bacterium]MDZ7303042.1 hypothetical protein [candidate division KSB1 bacterium]MDZ7312450.1 hypothetical protein [candidate division KSB1 bacterium]